MLSNIMKAFNCRIPANLNYVGPVVGDAMRHFQSVYGCIDEDTLFELRVILNELVLNAIKHGDKYDETKYVKVIAGICSHDRGYIIVEDDGEGYNYNCLLQKNKDPLDLVDLCDMKETGRGIMIVNNLCDRVRFNKKGNRVIVVKSLKKD